MKADQIQAVWCGPGGESPQIETWPQKQEAEERFLFTNDVPAVRGIFTDASPDKWHIVDAVELCRLLFPENTGAAISAIERCGSAEELYHEWQKCRIRLDAMPYWALELCSALFTSIDEEDLAALFTFWNTDNDFFADDTNWQSSFKPTVTRVERRVLPELGDCTPLNQDDVASYLGPDGQLAKLVEGYEPRPGQIQMVRAVTEAYNQGKHLIVEAGTGIGKSLAYLLPSALWAKLNDVPVVISTNTKNLQTQLIEKDLPAVLKMVESARTFPDSKPLLASVIKGRSNYLCLRRFSHLINGGIYELQRPEIKMLTATIIWSVITGDGDFDSLTGSGAVDPQFLHLLTSSSEECPGRSCPNYSRCFIQKAREKSLRANLIIANHSLVFAELAAEKPISIPRHSQIVFDEAHNLEDAATNFFTLSLTPGDVASLTNRLAQIKGRKSRGALFQLKNRVESGAVVPGDKEKFEKLLEDAARATIELSRFSVNLFRALHPLLATGESPCRYAFAPVKVGDELPAPDEKWAALRKVQSEFTEKLNNLKKLIGDLITMLQDPGGDTLNLAMGDINDLGASLSKIDGLMESMNVVLSGSDENYVFWIERSRLPGALAEAYAAPLKVGEFLSSHLYNSKSSIIFSSATLSVGGNFKYIGSRLGLNIIDRERLSVLTAQSPFNYLTQCSLLVPSYLPEPTGQDRSYVSELSSLIVQVACKYNGRTLVLFTSYEMMRQSAELIRSVLEERGIELLIQGESGSRNRITKVFRENGSKVLFGTQSFWEGVDVVGEALSCVIVARLPFASPSDPIVAARSEQIDREGGRSFFDLAVPIAVLKLRQGFGRLIRHRLDKGSVIIADTRILTKNYGRIFRSSLPVSMKNCTTLKEITENLIT